MTVTKKNLSRLFCALFLGLCVTACMSEVQEDPNAAAAEAAEGGMDADHDHSHEDGDADHSHDDSGENK